MQPYYHQPEGLLGHYAGIASRFLASLIDVIIISLSISAFAVIISNLPRFIQLATGFGPEVVDLITSTFPITEGVESSVTEWINTLVLFSRGLAAPATVLFVLLYHIFFVSTAGRTPGKAFMGIRVLTINGQRVPLWRATLRTLGYILDVLTLFIGFLIVLIDDRRQALHDKLSRTCVVYTWEARPEETFLAKRLEKLLESQQKNS